MRRALRRTSLLSLVLHAAWLSRRTLGWIAALLLLLVLQLFRCVGCHDGRAHLATFNIENYPKSERQVAAAFDVIKGLDAKAIAVQEIMDPSAFRRAAKERLGSSWDFVCTDRPTHRIGVLYDSDAFTLVSTRTYTETEVINGGKPAFEVRLRPDEGSIVRLIAVHLKAGGDSVDLRAKQLRALIPVASSAAASGDRVVIAGDFNATSKEDAAGIKALAAASGLRFSSEDVECTSFWNRRDGCVGSALDHVLSSVPAKVAAEAACRTEGCDSKPSCPVYRDEVSDHCPVSIELD